MSFFFGSSVDVDMYTNVGQGFVLMTVVKGGGGTCRKNVHASLPHERKKQSDLHPLISKLVEFSGAKKTLRFVTDEIVKIRQPSSLFCGHCKKKSPKTH